MEGAETGAVETSSKCLHPSNGGVSLTLANMNRLSSSNTKDISSHPLHSTINISSDVYWNAHPSLSCSENFPVSLGLSENCMIGLVLAPVAMNFHSGALP